jgi:hypothetical protein
MTKSLFSFPFAALLAVLSFDNVDDVNHVLNVEGVQLLTHQDPEQDPESKKYLDVLRCNAGKYKREGLEGGDRARAALEDVT